MRAVHAWRGLGAAAWRGDATLNGRPSCSAMSLLYREEVTSADRRAEAVAESLWIVDSGPLTAYGLALPLRMMAVRLSSGELWLTYPWSTVGSRRIGPIGHLVPPCVSAREIV